jgi:uncharacterized coiled-coil protein SlyX
MFISNKEKSEINEKFNHQKIQIESLIKHVAKLQVSMQGLDASQIPALVESNKNVTKSYWAHIGKFKTLEKILASLSSTNDMLRQNNESLIRRVKALETQSVEAPKLEARIPLKKPIGRPPKKIVLTADRVQALKDAGVWDDPSKRIQVIDEIIKQDEAQKIEERKIKQRGYNQKYKEKLKAQKAAQKEKA